MDKIWQILVDIQQYLTISDNIARYLRTYDKIWENILMFLMDISWRDLKSMTNIGWNSTILDNNWQYQQKNKNISQDIVNIQQY